MARVNENWALVVGLLAAQYFGCWGESGRHSSPPPSQAINVEPGRGWVQIALTDFPIDNAVVLPELFDVI